MGSCMLFGVKWGRGEETSRAKAKVCLCWVGPQQYLNHTSQQGLLHSCLPLPQKVPL